MIMNHSRKIIGLGGWLIVAFAAAAVGAIASIHARDFYAQLTRPSWAPPGSVFGPVWSVLYTMMGVAAWLVWKEGGFKAASGPLTLFLVQLVANALWSWLFFSWHLGAAAFVEILILWFLILWTTVAFWRRSTPAGALLVPYLAWVTFATALCFATWRLNPAQI